jgi:hypothetical protein
MVRHDKSSLSKWLTNAFQGIASNALRDNGIARMLIVSEATSAG